MTADDTPATRRPYADVRWLQERVVVSVNGCWLWRNGLDSNGYGVVRTSASRTPAHRYVYEALVGAIPKKLQLDHLCRQRRCVNPDHLQPVTQQENILRGTSPAAIAARQNSCIHGHPFTGSNLFIDSAGFRRCRTCQRQRDRRRAPRRRKAV